MTHSSAERLSSTPILMDWALLFGLGVMFGSSFMATDIAVSELPASLFVASRLVIAAVLLSAFFLLGGHSLPKGRVWWAILASAVFGHVLPFSLIAWGQETVVSSLAAIFMATMPLFVLLLTQMFTRDEKPSLQTAIGFGVAFVGIVILFGIETLSSISPRSLAQYAIISAALCYGINAVVTKWLGGLAPVQAMTCVMVPSALMALVPLFYIDIALEMPSNRAALAVVYAGFLPTALGAIMLIVLIRRQGAAFTSILNYIVPVVGVLFGIGIQKETMPPSGWLALFIIFAGVTLAQRRLPFTTKEPQL